MIEYMNTEMKTALRAGVLGELLMIVAMTA